MAEKSFGIKEINLIGASGTPTIESPNNLNLNAVNVAISTNVSIGGTLTVSGNVSVGGTLTYEDVTNIDSVGLVTAREGIFLPDNKQLQFGNAAGTADGTIESDGGNFLIQGTNASSTYLRGSTINIAVNGGSGSYGNSIVCDESGSSRVQLCYNGSQKLVTTNTGVNITGAITVGGSALTVDPTNADIQGMWTVGGSASGYTFTGPGQDGSETNPDIFLVRGQRYRFVNSLAGSHPFEFRNFDNNADHTDGITGSQSGTQDFNVQHDTPSALKYRCTIHTTSMLGNIYIIGGKRGILTSDTTLSTNSVSYDGIPSWATKITFLFHRLSLSNNNTQLEVRLRKDGSDITSTYNSVAYGFGDGSGGGNFAGTNFSSTDSLIMNLTHAAHWYSGKMEIEKVSSTQYVSRFAMIRNSSTQWSTLVQQRMGNGEITLASGPADGITISTTNSSYAMDSDTYTNKVSIYYE